MKTYAILMEPASYTLDRNVNIYDKLGIEYCYMKNSSEASDKNSDAICTENYPILKLIKFIKQILSCYDCIIMNGYISKEFAILFILNLFYHKTIGIDSDTQYSRPESRCKYLIKKVYLSIIFRDRHIYGLAGGTKTHFELFSKYGMPKSRIMLMPMMIDNNKFKNDNYNERSRSPFTFLYVGRLIECKNITVMIEAFLKLKETHANILLSIVGEGNLSQMLKENYQDENIIFKGKKYGKELITEYCNANVLILPSSYEPWGLVVNEAMSQGIPVIVSDQVGARYDLVDNKDTGYVFEYDNPDKLAACMQKCVDNGEHYKIMSYNSFNLLHNYWNYNLYNECLLNFIDVAKQNAKLR
ncbi:MAG: glycosyltransferase family 4 protein [Bacteroidales bacterium]